MKKNPAIRIELAGNTDNLGTESLNLKLSNNHVAAVASASKTKAMADQNQFLRAIPKKRGD